MLFPFALLQTIKTHLLEIIQLFTTPQFTFTLYEFFLMEMYWIIQISQFFDKNQCQMQSIYTE